MRLSTFIFLPKQRKRSAHERHWETVTSGEWASGARWADDKPRENLDAESVSLIHSGACGAFVHGLEDEFMGKCDFILPLLLINSTSVHSNIILYKP